MFPLDSIDMDKFIFDESKQSWDKYLSEIKKLLTPPCITTNDTALEDKKKDFDICNNSDISLEDKNEGLFSYNDEENFDDYV